MFNLIISSRIDSWENGRFELDRSRFGVEYTADEITDRYVNLTEETQSELMSFPTVFAIENEPILSRIGYITEIRIRSESLAFRYEFDPILPPLPPGALAQLKSEIDLGRWELTRTHWAIKDEPLFEILVRNGFVTQARVDDSIRLRNPPLPQRSLRVSGSNSDRVFIVHGHDEIAKLDVAAFIRSLGLEPIILHQQANAGMTIIEKIEHYSDVGFGVVLYTPCDTGEKVGSMRPSYRARQNVVFEHGYLIAKLGRDRVTPLVKGAVETPNDISGIVYVPMTSTEDWKVELKRELRNAGYAV